MNLKNKLKFTTSLEELKGKKLFISDNGVTLGKIGKEILKDNSNEPLLLVGPTKSGKDVCSIIPTLLKDWNESAVILDEYSKKYNLTSKVRENVMNNKILKFDPLAEESCHYNLLSELRIMSEFEAQDIIKISEILIKNDFDVSNFLSAIIIFVIYRNFLQNPQFIIENNVKVPIIKTNMQEIVEFIKEFNIDKLKEILDKNLIDNYSKNVKIKAFVKSQLLNLYFLYDIEDDVEDVEDVEEDEITELGKNKKIIDKGNHPLVFKEFSKILLSNHPEKKIESLKDKILTKLEIFKKTEVKENTSYSDFKIKDLVNSETPTSLYLCYKSVDILKLKSIFEILIFQITNLLVKKENNIDIKNFKKNKWRLLLLLDNFTELNRMKFLEDNFEYFSDFGIKLFLVLSSIEQFNSIYWKEYNARNKILKKCPTQLFFSTYSTETACYVSELFGTISYATNQIIPYFSFEKEKIYLETTIEKKIKPLISTKEFKKFPQDKIAIYHLGNKLIIAKKLLYFEEKEYKYRTL